VQSDVNFGLYRSFEALTTIAPLRTIKLFSWPPCSSDRAIKSSFLQSAVGVVSVKMSITSRDARIRSAWENDAKTGTPNFLIKVYSNSRGTLLASWRARRRICCGTSEIDGGGGMSIERRAANRVVRIHATIGLLHSESRSRAT
jgi:hypothetical protein